jgi:hypothetical protein
MDRNNGRSAIRMSEKVMAAFDPQNDESCV